MQNCIDKIPRYLDVPGMLQMFPSRASGVGMPSGFEEAAAADKCTGQHEDPLSLQAIVGVAFLKPRFLETPEQWWPSELCSVYCRLPTALEHSLLHVSACLLSTCSFVD